MRVVHCKRERFTHYIGRPGPFGNPFPIGQLESGQYRTRTESISAYERHARRSPELLKKIAALPPGSILGCWCAEALPYGDVIVTLWHELRLNGGTLP